MSKISKNTQQNLITISTLATVLMLMPQYAYAQLEPVENMATVVQDFLTAAFARSAGAIALSLIHI